MIKAEVMKKWDRDVVNSIIDLGQIFVKETGFPVTFNRQKVYDRIWWPYFQDDGDVIVVKTEGGVVVGGAVVYATADWQEEKFGYIEKMFVDPKYRREGVGRVIAEKCAEWFDDQDCLFSFATSTANIGRGRQFTNLMSKYGYIDVGPTLARKINHG